DHSCRDDDGERRAAGQPQDDLLCAQALPSRANAFAPAPQRPRLSRETVRGPGVEVARELLLEARLQRFEIRSELRLEHLKLVLELRVEGVLTGRSHGMPLSIWSWLDEVVLPRSTRSVRRSRRSPHGRARRRTAARPAHAP